MPTLPNRKAEFRELFLTKPWVLDGAMATMLFAKGAPSHKMPEELNLTLAPLVRDVHREFLAAGAEIIRTNTFGGNRIRLEKSGLDSKLKLVNEAAVRIARAAAGDTAFVAGSVGSTGELIEPLGRLSQEEACAVFKHQAAALDGVDLFVLETFRSVAELRSAVCGVREAAGSEIVLIASVTVDENGNLWDGTPPERFGPAISALATDAIGVNCSGPHTVAAVIERLRKVTSKSLSAVPSFAGDEAYFAQTLAETGAALVGGCCQTTPQHIKALREQTLEIRPGQDAEAVEPEPETEIPLAKRSKLGAKLAAKKFVDDAELASLVTIRTDGRSPYRLQEELLAIHVRGDRNILCHSEELAYLASQLNKGLDMGGNAITQTSFVIGTEGIFSSPHADFLLSPPIFDIEELPKSKIPVIATVWGIPDARTAAYAIHERGARIPEELLARIHNGEGEAVAAELTKALRKTAAGVRRYTRT